MTAARYPQDARGRRSARLGDAGLSRDEHAVKAAVVGDLIPITPVRGVTLPKSLGALEGLADPGDQRGPGDRTGHALVRRADVPGAYRKNRLWPSPDDFVFADPAGEVPRPTR
jgi:hypothetical protein